MNTIAKMVMAVLLSGPVLAVGADNPGDWPLPPKEAPASEVRAQPKEQVAHTQIKKRKDLFSVPWGLVYLKHL